MPHYTVTAKRQSGREIVNAGFAFLTDALDYFNFLTDNGATNSPRFLVTLWDNQAHTKVK